MHTVLEHGLFHIKRGGKSNPLEESQIIDRDCQDGKKSLSADTGTTGITVMVSPRSALLGGILGGKKAIPVREC